MASALRAHTQNKFEVKRWKSEHADDIWWVEISDGNNSVVNHFESEEEARQVEEELKTLYVEEMCHGCHKNPAAPSHACPYKEDMDNDTETLCNCCDACRDQCCMDI